MPRSNNLIKKDIFNKIGSERQFSNPKSSLMKRNNSEIYKTLYNSKAANVANVSKSKFTSNNATNKKASIVKESINLYTEIKKDLFSPSKNVGNGISSKQSLHTKPASKNGSMTSRKQEESKSTIKSLKNYTSELKKSTQGKFGVFSGLNSQRNSATNKK
jgi:hypothetical protein